jgi:hypothetical protein
MKKLGFLLIAAVLLVACEPQYKKCETQVNDIYLEAYNDILNEIIVKGTYNRYLGEEEERIFKLYSESDGDTEGINREVIRLHNEIFNHPTRFCTIYLDTLLRPALDSWKRIQKDTSAHSYYIKHLLNQFSVKGQGLIDSLNSLQTKYVPEDFSVCIADLKSLNELKVEKPTCYIGTFAFSKLILNSAKTKGLLFYKFMCGGLCGYGRLVLIEKKEGHWSIKKSLMMSVS